MKEPFKSPFGNPIVNPLGNAMGGEIYIPWEAHPDWGLFSGTEASPTIYNSTLKSVTTTRTISGGEWFPIMNVKYGIIGDCEMSCVINYEGNTTTYETYMLAKGRDGDNFVGATSYNRKIMLYERVNGAWRNLNVSVPVAGTIGKEVRMIIEGVLVTLIVDGVTIGSANTTLTGDAYMGSLLRGLPISGLLWTAMELTGDRIAVSNKGENVTYNTDLVTYRR